ncbi:MAG: hypothetical protein ACTSXV_00315 [Alphaproteobacteria bacterium]
MKKLILTLGMVGLSFSFLATATASDPEAEFAESFDAEDFNTENENMSQDLLAQGQQVICQYFVTSQECRDGEDGNLQCTPANPRQVANGPLPANATHSQERAFYSLQDEYNTECTVTRDIQGLISTISCFSMDDEMTNWLYICH